MGKAQSRRTIMAIKNFFWLNTVDLMQKCPQYLISDVVFNIQMALLLAGVIFHLNMVLFILYIYIFFFSASSMNTIWYICISAVIWTDLMITCSMTVFSHHWGPIRVMAAIILACNTPKAQSWNTQRKEKPNLVLLLTYIMDRNKDVTLYSGKNCIWFARMISFGVTWTHLPVSFKKKKALWNFKWDLWDFTYAFLWPQTHSNTAKEPSHFTETCSMRSSVAFMTVRLVVCGKNILERYWIALYSNCSVRKD